VPYVDALKQPIEMRNIAIASRKSDFRNLPVSRIVEQITRAGRNPFVVDVLSNRASRPSKQLVYVALRAMKLSRSREDFTYDHVGAAVPAAKSSLRPERW
jgi:hypothetical protein